MKSDGRSTHPGAHWRFFCAKEARIAAGLAGETYCGWLFVKYLWVSEDCAAAGVGTRIDGSRGSTCSRARLSLGMAGHIQLSGARVLRKAGLRGVRAGSITRPTHRRHFMRKVLAPSE